LPPLTTTLDRVPFETSLPEVEVPTEGGEDSDYIDFSNPEIQAQKSGSYPRVGGRLQDFWETWQAMGVSQWTVEVLKEGYQLEFHRKPRLTRIPMLNLNSKGPLVDQEILDMIAKGALEKVDNPNSPGFYSRIFLVPKKTGGMRPVIDLKRLNQFLVHKHFKMESGQSIRRALKQGMWVYSIDLKDAYFHIPIHPASRKYLRISFQGEVYQFRALPFGVSSAPWIFTKVFQQLIIVCRRRGCHLHMYLDDWLGKEMDRLRCQQDRDRVLQIIIQMGCLVNWEKSELQVTQNFIFVGIRYNLAEGRIAPAEEKLDRVKLLAKPFLSGNLVPAVAWQRLLGLLNILEWQVPWGKIHLRNLQWSLLTQWSAHRQPNTCLVQVSQAALADVHWWLKAENVFKGVPLHYPNPQIFMNTDASLEGWGAHSGEEKFQGLWSPSDKGNHINVLELRAVRRALEALCPPKHSRILVKTDNTTVVAHINKQGGTHSWDLMQETFLLYQELEAQNWKLRACYFPGSRNVIADSLSRGSQVLPGEWSLHPAVVKAIFKVWGTPHLDLFATKDNAKLPVFVSPLPDPEAWAEDALAISWTNLWAYAFPPTSIMVRVVEKILQSVCHIILVAPAWPGQSWFNLLLDLSTEDPLRIPVFPHVLKQTSKHVFHSNPAHLRLHAWNLQNKTSGNRDLTGMFLRESWVLSERLPEECMEPGGECFVLGVSKGRQILSKPLFLR